MGPLRPRDSAVGSGIHRWVHLNDSNKLFLSCYSKLDPPLLGTTKGHAQLRWRSKQPGRPAAKEHPKGMMEASQRGLIALAQLRGLNLEYRQQWGQHRPPKGSNLEDHEGELPGTPSLLQFSETAHLYLNPSLPPVLVGHTLEPPIQWEGSHLLFFKSQEDTSYPQMPQDAQEQL